jgi:hypothetical protein
MMNAEPRRAGTGAEFQFGWPFERAAKMGKARVSGCRIFRGLRAFAVKFLFSLRSLRLGGSIIFFWEESWIGLAWGVGYAWEGV